MRGVICVERSVRGVIEWLPLADQHHYREWQGCFSLLGERSMRWEILFQWNDELNAPPRTAIVSDDPLSLKDDTVMYTLDADEVANGIVGDYLDFRIVEAVEEDEA